MSEGSKARTHIVIAICLSLVAAACSPSTGQTPCETDADGDGYNACNDCADDDAARNPGATESCGDGIDNDCDALTDEGCGECDPAGPETRTCGVTGSTCIQTCRADATWGNCLPPDGSTPDYQTDVNHCGQCGNACPEPRNAQAVCVGGVCGRGPCNAGYFDLDVDGPDGCFWTCEGANCTRETGETVTLTAPPIPETGLAVSAVSSGAALGTDVQTSSTHTNYGVLGEGGIATPDAPLQRSSRFQHQGGFMASQPE